MVFGFNNVDHLKVKGFPGFSGGHVLSMLNSMLSPAYGVYTAIDVRAAPGLFLEGKAEIPLVCNAKDECKYDTNIRKHRISV